MGEGLASRRPLPAPLPEGMDSMHVLLNILAPVVVVLSLIGAAFGSFLLGRSTDDPDAKRMGIALLVASAVTFIVSVVVVVLLMGVDA
jgi:cation transporter-like permease